MSLMQKRTSIRKYQAKKVEEEKVIELLKSAMQSPSANNQQPWEFVVVDDEALLKKLSHASPGAWPLQEAPLAIVTILKPGEKSPHYAIQDMSAATQNILLEATFLGLGAVWIGCFPLEERTTHVKEALSIPSPYEPFSIIAIGYPLEEKTKPLRYDASLVHKNRYH